MRTCIVTKAYYQPHQTFVNNHVANLFGGNVVVLAADRLAEDPIGRPTHYWAPGSRGRKQGILRDAMDLWRYRTTAVPDREATAGIQAFLADQGVQAVLVEFGDVATRIVPALANSGLPVFSYFRGSDASKFPRRTFRTEALSRTMPHLTGVFAVSQFLLDNLAARGVTHPGSYVIPSGVDTDRFVPATKRTGHFVAVGRLVATKRPDLSIAAFCQAARDCPEARLDVVGDGPMADQCRAVISQHRMEAQVIMHGRQPHDVVRQILSAASVFLQHSVMDRRGGTEGLPTAIQEAMASGAVVISTRHAGIPEAVEEGATGWLVDEGDAAGFEARIREALARPDQLPAMAERARAAAVERFDNRRLTRRLETLMVELAGRPAQRTGML